MGVTWAFFQSCGKVPLLNDLLKIMDNGIAINSPTDFIIEIGQPSGPGGLFVLCMFIILSRTISGVKSIDSDMGGEPLGSIAGVEVISSLVKTVPGKIIIKQGSHFKIRACHSVIRTDQFSKALFLILKAFSNPRGAVTNPRNTIRARVRAKLREITIKTEMVTYCT